MLQLPHSAMEGEGQYLSKNIHGPSHGFGSSDTLVEWKAESVSDQPIDGLIGEGAKDAITIYKTNFRQSL